MDALAVDGRDALPEAVEPGFPGTPLELPRPVLRDRLQVGYRDPAPPAVAAGLFWPARAEHPLAQVQDFVFLNIDGEMVHAFKLDCILKVSTSLVHGTE